MNFSNRNKTYIFVLTLLSIATVSSMASSSDPVPAPEQSGPIAIVGATIHPIDRGPIEDGTIVFDRGKITHIGFRVQNRERKCWQKLPVSDPSTCRRGRNFSLRSRNFWRRMRDEPRQGPEGALAR